MKILASPQAEAPHSIRCKLTDVVVRDLLGPAAGTEEALDQAVAAAYGWGDLDLGHGFHVAKQGGRYTLREPARRTVIDRLLTLNVRDRLLRSLH